VQKKKNGKEKKEGRRKEKRSYFLRQLLVVSQFPKSVSVNTGTPYNAEQTRGKKRGKKENEKKKKKRSGRAYATLGVQHDDRYSASTHPQFIADLDSRTRSKTMGAPE